MLFKLSGTDKERQKAGKIKMILVKYIHIDAEKMSLFEKEREENRV